MQRSTERILTTHVGSLPRPPDLLEMINAKAIPDKGLKKRIHRVSAPTLIVWGADDRLVPSVYANEFSKRHADGRVHIITSAGHAPHLEHPAAVAGAGWEAAIRNHAQKPRWVPKADLSPFAKGLSANVDHLQVKPVVKRK